MTLKSQTLPRLLKIGNVRKIVEVAGFEPANSQTDINSTYTIEAKQKQINKKEFKGHRCKSQQATQDHHGVVQAEYIVPMVPIPRLHRLYGIGRGPKRQLRFSRNRTSSVGE